MKILILSGGSGSDSLIRGLCSIGGSNVEITNLINLYDDGKSTGVCRRIMNCLGPSDLRKVQYSQIDQPSKGIEMFFNDRVNMTYNSFIDNCNSILYNLPKTQYTELMYKCIPIFKMKLLSYGKRKNINIDDILKDFNVANICYSTLFYTHGIKKTIQIFKTMFNIKHNVVTNSYTNSTLSAQCVNTDKKFLEGDIVSLNGKYQIEKLFLEPAPMCNFDILDVIHNTDLIIISSGTPYSSIYPTLMNNILSNEIMSSTARKFIIGNTNFDGDSYDLNLDGIVNLYNKKLDMSEFEIIINTEANKEFTDIKYPIKQKHFEPLGKTKHDKLLLAKTVYSLFFNININSIKKNNTKLVFDFDGTVYDNTDSKTTLKNFKLISYLQQSYNIEIVTGNSIEHIRYLDTETALPDILIWANGANDMYVNYQYKRSYSNKIISDEDIIELSEFALNNNCFFENRRNKCFTIKCINISREIILSILRSRNHHIDKKYFIRKNGKTSIDIIVDNPDKHMIYSNKEFKNMIYFGDSETGNDKIMLNKAVIGIISNVKLTNILLCLLVLGGN
jgi:2-phospho-L-lactate transferase/gluconeogenesis factor (CofD/UPF0052 family)